jgi:hypothetical protein
MAATRAAVDNRVVTERSGKGELMRTIRCVLPVITALAAIVGFTATVAANDVTGVNQTLLSATSPYEDIADAALAGNDAKVAEALAAADRQAETVASVLSADADRRFEERRRAIHVAVAHDDREATATAAVDTFGLLLGELDPDHLEIPKEASLLDYAGFDLQVLATAPEPDWVRMEAVVEQADAWWKLLENQTSDAALQDAFSSAIAGMREAVGARNLPMLRFAAQMDIDLVDLLEHHFAGAGSSGDAGQI